MSRPLPLDAQLAALTFLHPIAVMKARCVCRAWRDEAPRVVTTVALVDDFTDDDEAYDFNEYAEIHGRPLPGHGKWFGKFPALSYPRFALLKNVQRLEGAPARPHAPLAGPRLHK